MHEFSICARIVDAVQGELSRLDPPAERLLVVRLVVGALHQIVPEQLAFAYETLTGDTPLEGSRLELVVRPVVAQCAECGWVGEIAPPLFRCGDCGAFGARAISGTELYLEHLEVETASDH
jgi:hydrogenase nickel incorporation protein HypA/HybF